MNLVFYSWTALKGVSGSSVAMGITDDRSRAMRAGEEILSSGHALVVIIDAVRPAMMPHSLAPSYVRIGVSWLGRRTAEGEVNWQRFFGADNRPDAGPGPSSRGT